VAFYYSGLHRTKGSAFYTYQPDSVTSIGTLIVLMKNVGREDKIEFTMNNFPPIVKNIAVLTNLLSTLLTRGRHSCIVGLELPKGRPKYVKGNEPA
jgi:hypothetical protein